MRVVPKRPEDGACYIEHVVSSPAESVAWILHQGFHQGGFMERIGVFPRNAPVGPSETGAHVLTPVFADV